MMASPEGDGAAGASNAAAAGPANKATPPPTKTVESKWTDADAADKACLASVVEAWKQTVSVQMHFNEICMTLRNIAITLIAAVIGLAGYSTKEGIYLDIRGYQVPVGTVVALGGLVGWVAFYSMDRHWYHVFLRSAGIHASRIEERWKKQLPELMLSSQISEDSKRVVLGVQFHSNRRLNWFYAAGTVILVLTGVVVWFAHPRVTPPAAAANAASSTTPAVNAVAPAVSAPAPPSPGSTIKPAGPSAEKGNGRKN